MEGGRECATAFGGGGSFRIVEFVLVGGERRIPGFRRAGPCSLADRVSGGGVCLQHLKMLLFIMR